MKSIAVIGTVVFACAFASTDAETFVVDLGLYAQLQLRYKSVNERSQPGLGIGVNVDPVARRHFT
jgi:hypothetical protein